MNKKLTLIELKRLNVENQIIKPVTVQKNIFKPQCLMYLILDFNCRNPIYKNKNGYKNGYRKGIERDRKDIERVYKGYRKDIERV
jgi:hypothetical protein